MDLFPRMTVVETARSVRNYLRKGALPQWMSVAVEGSSEHGTAWKEKDIGEEGFDADNSHATIREDSDGEGSAEHTRGEVITHQKLHAGRPRNQEGKAFETLHFTGPVIGNQYGNHKLALQDLPVKKRRKVELSHHKQNQMAGTTKTSPRSNRSTLRAWKKSISAERAASPLTPITHRPVTFMTNLQIPNTDVVRHEYIYTTGAAALPNFIELARSTYGILPDQVIKSLEVYIDGRKINISVDDEEKEWEWGLVLGIIHFSGIPEDEIASVDIRAEG